MVPMSPTRARVRATLLGSSRWVHGSGPTARSMRTFSTPRGMTSQSRRWLDMADIKAWAVDTTVRAVKTSAQSLVALFGASSFNVLHGVDWKTDLGIALGAGVVSVLQNIQSFPNQRDGHWGGITKADPQPERVMHLA